MVTTERGEGQRTLGKNDEAPAFLAMDDGDSVLLTKRRVYKFSCAAVCTLRGVTVLAIPSGVVVPERYAALLEFLAWPHSEDPDSAGIRYNAISIPIGAAQAERPR